MPTGYGFVFHVGLTFLQTSVSSFFGIFLFSALFHVRNQYFLLKYASLLVFTVHLFVFAPVAVLPGTIRLILFVACQHQLHVNPYFVVGYCSLASLFLVALETCYHNHYVQTASMGIWRSTPW